MTSTPVITDPRPVARGSKMGRKLASWGLQGLVIVALARPEWLVEIDVIAELP